MRGEAFLEFVNNAPGPGAQAGCPVQSGNGQVVTAHLVEHQHVKGSGGAPLFDVAVHVKPAGIGTVIHQLVDQTRVTVESEDDWLVFSEQLDECCIVQAVGVVVVRDESEKVDHIHHPHPQFRQLAPQQPRRGHDLLGRHVAGRGQNHVGIASIIAGPVPHRGTACAVFSRGVHVQPLRDHLLGSDDEVDITPAVQAVIHDREQAVGVRGKVDACHRCLLVRHVIDEAGYLVGVTIVILSPDVRSEQVVERSQRFAPGYLLRDLEPLGVLVQH